MKSWEHLTMTAEPSILGASAAYYMPVRLHRTCRPYFLLTYRERAGRTSRSTTAISRQPRAGERVALPVPIRNRLSHRKLICRSQSSAGCILICTRCAPGGEQRRFDLLRLMATILWSGAYFCRVARHSVWRWRRRRGNYRKLGRISKRAPPTPELAEVFEPASG